MSEQTNISLAKRISEIFNINANHRTQSSRVCIDAKNYSNNHISFSFGIPKPYPFDIISTKGSTSFSNSCTINESEAPYNYKDSDFVSVENLVSLIYELKDKRVSDSLVQIFRFLHEDGYEPVAPTLSTVKDVLYVRFVRYNVNVSFAIDAEFK